MARKITNYDRHVRIYDNSGETIDRYTAVYVKPSVIEGRRYYGYTSMSADQYPVDQAGLHGGGRIMARRVDEDHCRSCGAVLSSYSDVYCRACRIRVDEIVRQLSEELMHPYPAETGY